MNFCPECGSKIEDNATFCQECGNKVSEEEKEKLPRRGIKRINLLAIFAGIITWVAVMILFVIAFSDVSLNDDFTVLLFIITQAISSSVAGYIGNTSYKNGIVNGGILFIISTSISTFFGGFYGLVIGGIIFLSFAIIGGFFGSFVKKIT